MPRLPDRLRSMPIRRTNPLIYPVRGTFAEKEDPDWPASWPPRESRCWSLIGLAGFLSTARAGRSVWGPRCHRRAAVVEDLWRSFEESGDGPHSPSDVRLGSGSTGSGRACFDARVSQSGEACSCRGWPWPARCDGPTGPIHNDGALWSPKSARRFSTWSRNVVSPGSACRELGRRCVRRPPGAPALIFARTSLRRCRPARHAETAAEGQSPPRFRDSSLGAFLVSTGMVARTRGYCQDPHDLKGRSINMLP